MAAVKTLQTEKFSRRITRRAYTVRAFILQVMPVAQLTLEVRIEHAQSLKDRRQVVRSLKDQLRQGFNISVAEIDEAVTWQSATIGVVALSRSRDYLHGLVEEVERARAPHPQRTRRGAGGFFLGLHRELRRR